MNSRPLVVKVRHEECIWRLKVPTEEVSYNKVREVVEKMVSLEQGRIIRYKDDEGDMCVLTPETFDDALEVSQRSNGLIRLDVVNPRSFEPNPVPSAAEEHALPYHMSLSRHKQQSSFTSRSSPQISSTAESRRQSRDSPAHAVSRTWGPFERSSEASQLAAQPPLFSGPANPYPTVPATTTPHVNGIDSKEKPCDQSVGVVQPMLPKSSDRIYAPKPVLRTFLRLNEMNMLTPRMITSVTVSFIPLMIQRCSRHTDRLSHYVRNDYERMRPTLQSMLLAITHIRELHEFMPLLQAVVNSGPNTPEITEFGQWFVGLLKSFSTLCFDTQVQVLLVVAPSWIPCFRAAVRLGHFDVPPTPIQQVTHHGVDCDGCGTKPIVGPRFKCQVCDYDLCGECYPFKSTLHAELHDFVCVLRSGRDSTKDTLSSDLSTPALSAYVSSLERQASAGRERAQGFN
ncbi:hypothetical protein Pmar_PMAR002890 [Perkinsus marinus ATCC 50983]|uniref:ZZ-type domain-containing protein n=1 Tax=Perkinsus marinus (strain ATCC 50983 / TXsc) TaxID=423536 RepID=C5LQT6_PERM5|nr:hypothetical protein Pmar_PMAR002890 [Perkinsus marinus ATCC 50983]EER00821.1 hypothetical protein Pmar_PMAR002890 [Perkinsus marinus ATCC 50983]|eukprot:XP_002768103.1 hypothetical protein Pmar_PMAR002890 [Perkinsus marinus ATCC 50983]